MSICVGKPIIQILASEGAWQSKDGESLVAASELFHKDPYAEIERLMADIAELSRVLNGIANREDFAREVLKARDRALRQEVRKG